MKTDVDITDLIDVAFVTNHDDWEGLYINGTLSTEGHRLTIQDFAEAIGLKLNTKTAGPWLLDRGSLPELEEEFDQFNK